MKKKFNIDRISEIQTSQTGYKFFFVYIKTEITLIDDNITEIKAAGYNKGQRVPTSMLPYSEEFYELFKQAKTIELEVF